MAKVEVTNVSDGPRGLNDVNRGVVMIEPKRSDVLELSEGERASAEATGYFEFRGNAALVEEPGPLDQSVEALAEHLASIDDPAEIDRLIEAETAGKSRKGALAALEARRDELKDA
jgi:hypothetical protein